MDVCSRINIFSYAEFQAGLHLIPPPTINLKTTNTRGAVSIVPFNRPETTIKACNPAEMTTKENKFIIVISQLDHLLPQIDVRTVKKVTFIKLINQACNSVQNKKSPI